MCIKCTVCVYDLRSLLVPCSVGLMCSCSVIAVPFPCLPSAEINHASVMGDCAQLHLHSASSRSQHCTSVEPEHCTSRGETRISAVYRDDEAPPRSLAPVYQCPVEWSCNLPDNGPGTDGVLLSVSGSGKLNIATSVKSIPR